MRQHLGLFLTASFLFLSQGVQGSNINHDDDGDAPVAQDVGGVQVASATSSAAETLGHKRSRGDDAVEPSPKKFKPTGETLGEKRPGGDNAVEPSPKKLNPELQCYRTPKDGERVPLFDENTGNLLDDRIKRGDPSVPVVVNQQVFQEDSESLDKTWFQTLLQSNTVGSLHLSVQLEIFQYLDPKSQNHLLQTCRYYRAFAQPVSGQEHAGVPHDLRIDLLMTSIAQQSGDFDLFIKDQRRTFWEQGSTDMARARYFQTQRIEQLRNEIASGYYKGTLSANTDHGKAYRSIGPGNIIAERLELVLNSRNLRLVPLNFPEVSSIHSLDLSTNQLTVDPDVSRLLNLTEFNLSNNQLTVAPDVSVLPKMLQTLNLSGNKLTAAPVLAGLLNLVWINLSNNQLTAAPVLAGLPNLMWLYLSNNQLKVAPVLTGLMNLGYLDLSNNQLTVAPVLTGLMNLGYLDLSNNQLRDGPDLSELPNLVKLYLHNNQLTVAPDVLGLTKLEVLNLCNNQLTVAPDLSELPKLEVLNLCNNQLTVAPDVLGLLNLVHLNLSNNQITEPPVLTGLSNLRELYLSNNQITEPFVLTGLLNLEVLELDPNLCGDRTLLQTLRGMNSERDHSHKIWFFAVSKDAAGKEVITQVSLD